MNEQSIIRRIAFIVHTREMLNHYGPVWDAMDGTPFDILLHDGATLEPGDIKPSWQAQVETTESVFKSGSRYECLVTNHVMGLTTFGQPGPITKYLGNTNLRFMYAAGKLRHNLAPWNKYYDGILCFGPYHERAFRKVVDVPVRQMGFPRFDRFFNGDYEIDKIAESHNCDPSRPTLVWLPTWRELSSVGHFNEEVAALTDDYNVVVKVHPLMPSMEPEKVEQLKILPFNRVIDTPEDNLPLYCLADSMLFDYGGPPFGAIYIDKPFILLDAPSAENDQLTGPNSPDILLRRNFAHFPPGSNKIREVLSNPNWRDRHSEIAGKWRNQLFAKNYGSSASFAADAIINRKWLAK